MVMRWNKLEDEACSVARTVSVIGDRWTLLILRDCFLRVRRFEEFQARLGVTRPILASRLRKLVKDFVLARVAYQERPLRYEYRLTQKGLDLYPIVMSIVHWGDVHMAGKKGRPLLHQHVNCGKTFDPVMICSACGEPLSPKQVHVHRGPGATSPRHLPPSLQTADTKRRRASRTSRSQH
jgi:DNA-binding HxlR family transcriptional regulator